MRRILRRACLTALLLLLVLGLSRYLRVPQASAAQAQPSPDAVCARCHQAIFNQYEASTKAAGSGPVSAGLLTGEYRHPASAVQYRVFTDSAAAAWFTYNRQAGEPGGALAGRQELLYYVGSGQRGRTYLYQQSGQWFELPINYYGRRAAWGMAPHFDDVTRMPGALPVDGNCLHCHATNVSTATAESASNHLGERPWAQGGIGCSACHGDPAAHLAQGGTGPILNPAKLSPERRDSVCIQCHLEGDAVVYRQGRSLSRFHPGDLLSDDAVYFVRASQATGGARASSQYEALLQSACKRASGDRLTCTTCHDAHGEPAPEQRVAFYRARCLSCHTSPALAVMHHPEQPDCAGCHMPQRRTADISHEQVTDHDIERKPAHTDAHSGGEEATLVAVGGFAAGDRELGLAYAQLAGRGQAKAAERALALLGRAEQAEEADGTSTADSSLHTNLGFLEQAAGKPILARQEYVSALTADPYAAVALGNLAVLSAQAGDPVRAQHLLERLITADPTQTAAGLNLIRIECALGETGAAQTVAHALLPFSPDNPDLRGTLEAGVCRSEPKIGANAISSKISSGLLFEIDRVRTTSAR